MSRNIRTERGLFGQYIHYENGRKVGESWPGMLEGSYNHYDNDGNFAGSSHSGIVADFATYDGDSRFVGTSNVGLFGTLNHYTQDGYEGTTTMGILGYDTELNGGGEEAAPFCDGCWDY